MFEDPDVLVCFRGDFVWFLDTLKPSITECKAGILWKPKTKNKVCKVHAQSPKKTYIAREEKPVLKEYAYFGDFRASFHYQFKLDGTVGISDSLTFLQNVVDNKAHLQGLAISARKHPMFSPRERSEQ